MTTKAASGASATKATPAAVAEAMTEALGGLGGAPVSFGFLFASPEHSLAAAVKAARAVLPGISIMASSSAGEFTERGLLHGGVVVLLVASSDFTMASGLTSLTPGARAAAVALCTTLPEARKTAQRAHHKHLTSVLLTDGLAGSGETLVNDLVDQLPLGSQVVGGAAADAGRFKETVVGVDGAVLANGASVLHLFSAARLGIGVRHGLRPTSNPMRVTRSVNNVVFELDGAPAFEAYRRHAQARGITLEPKTAGAYMIGNELGIHFFDKVSRVRAPLSVGADLSLSCAASIPEGAHVSILDGEPDSMIEAVRAAAEEAKSRLDGVPPAAVLVFDCICRGMILNDAFQQEIDAVRSVFGDVPVAGFLTYGEIARYSGSVEVWHNATAVVVAIPG